MFNTFKAEIVTVFTIFFLFQVFLLTACSEAPIGDAKRGQRWFNMHNCVGCHGKHANDGRAPKIAALDRNFGSFIHFLRNPDSVSMPDFPEEKISNQDAADIYAWLKSIPK